MFLKSYKPLTGSQRNKKKVALAISTNLKCKPLCHGFKGAVGKNKTGQITAASRGGGVKRLFKVIDYWRRFTCQAGIVQRIEYNARITGNIALIEYSNRSKQYILAAEGLQCGDIINNGVKKSGSSKLGSAFILKYLTAGTLVYNIELRPGKGGQIVRAAGTYGKILRGGTRKIVRIRLPSGDVKNFSNMCAASVGRVSNVWHKSDVLGGAGIKRRMGRRPKVRGTAKNAVDHPHGGKSGPGRSSVTPWGKPTK